MGKPFPGAFSFVHHPWLREIHDAQDEEVVGQKAAQMGFTEVALNKTFFSIDVLQEAVLYILPTDGDASDFSSSRFDPALEASEHLRSMFTDVKNVGHKRAGSASLYVRGSRSRSQLKSIPAGRIMFDEYDEMNQKNMPLALERGSGQVNIQNFILSTPTIEEHGINVRYKLSTMEDFHFRCPHCSKLIALIDLDDCLVVTADSEEDPKILESYLRCPRPSCHGRIEHEEKPHLLKDGIWVPAESGSTIRGFHITQLYSSAKAGRPSSLAKAVLRARTSPEAEQELYNSKMGSTHEVKGARVLQSDIKECQGGYLMRDTGLSESTIITMGVDVQPTQLFYEIDEWTTNASAYFQDINLCSTPRLLRAGTVAEFEDLDPLMHTFGCFAVIDAQPEKRNSVKFCRRWSGRAWYCFYTDHTRSKEIVEDEDKITVDRTTWLDISQGRIKKHNMRLPQDLPIQWQDHIKAPVRIYTEDSMGNPVGRYVSGNKSDDFAHARNYSEIALSMALSFANNQDMTDAPN